MGKWVHRLTWVDPEALIGHCVNCGQVALRLKTKPNGSVRYICREAEREYTNTVAAKARKQRWRQANPDRVREHETTRRRKGYREHLAETCERCGFQPTYRSQLDVHHKDGDHSNNDVANLETLCANCHRLVHTAVPRPAKSRPETTNAPEPAGVGGDHGLMRLWP